MFNFESTVIYGENDLGLSLSKAFLVPTPNIKKFKNVEKRRGCSTQLSSFKKNSKLAKFNQETSSTRFSFAEQESFNKNFTLSSIQPEQLTKFEAGLKTSSCNQSSFMSSIQNTITETKSNCSCCITENSAISFNIKMASTPKKTNKRVGYCRECEPSMPSCCLKQKGSEVKKIKLSSESRQLFKDVTTSTNIYFRSLLKRKSSKKSNDITTSTKKCESKAVLAKKKYSELEYKLKEKQVRREGVKVVNDFAELNNFNFFNQQISSSNQFNQFGELQVWYV